MGGSLEQVGGELAELAAETDRMAARLASTDVTRWRSLAGQRCNDRVLDLAGTVSRLAGELDGAAGLAAAHARAVASAPLPVLGLPVGQWPGPVVDLWG